MAMQKQLAATAPSTLNNARRGFNQDFANAGLLKDYSIQASKAKTATQMFTESLVKQDVGVKQAIASRKIFSDVLKEQINLQKMLAVQWSKGPGGTLSADIIMPKGVDQEVGKLTNSLNANVKALATNKIGTAAWAQAADVAKMRMGLFNEILSSSADNMIKWGKNTQWAGRQLMVGFTVPFAAFAAVAGIAANNVDKELTRIVKVYDTTAQTVMGKEQELQQVRSASMGMATQIAYKYGAAVQDTLNVEAELAATGLQGANLMKSSAEVMRVATLGEMDYQKATQLSISLQNAFGLSTQETTDAMNYMNAVENATSLSLQDFADATPRAAAALAGVGVSVKEMGVLLVAMKERGVDATEGANALKSGVTRMLNPTNKANDSFKAMGINLKAISDESGGNLFKALQLMGSEFKRVGLSATQQQKLIADAFGTYQFNRLNAALQGITSETGQAGKAFELMGNSAADNADLAKQELDRAANSISGKFKRAIEGLKAEISTMGGPFIEIATTVVKSVVAILKAMNSLPGGVKKFGALLAITAAIAGPLIMVAGLFGNLIGQVLKMGTSLVMLTTKYRTMTVEQKAQALLSKQNSVLWDNEASSAQLLNAQLAQLTSRFEMLAVAQAQANGQNITGFGAPAGFIGPQGPTLKQDANGKYRRENGTFASTAEVKNFQAMQNASSTIVGASEKTAKNWTGIAGSAAGLAVAGGVATSMVAPTSDVVNNLTNAALIAATIGPLLLKGLKTEKVAEIGSSLIGKLGFAKGGKLAAGATATFKTIGLRIAALGPTLLRLAGPIGIIGGAALMVFLKIRNEEAKSDAAMKKIGESAQDWADILGYIKVESGKITDAQGNQVDTIDNLVGKLRKANAPLVDQLRLYKQLNQEGKLLDAVTMEGIKVKQSGGTAEQAKKAMKIALMAAGFTEQEVDVTILPKITVDLTDQKQVIDKQVDLMGKALDDAIKSKTQQGKWEGFSRFISGDANKLNTSGKRQAWNLANQFWETFQQQDSAGRLKYFEQFQKNFTDEQNNVWAGISKDTKDNLAKVNIQNMQEVLKMVQDQKNLSTQDFYGKYGSEKIFAFQSIKSSDMNLISKTAEAEQELAQQIAKDNGATDDQIKNIKTLNDVRAMGLNMASMTIDKAKEGYTSDVRDAQVKGRLSEADQLNILNQWRMAAGMDKASSVAQGFTNEVKKNTNSLDENSNSLDNSIMSAEEWASAWTDARKTAMSGAQDMALQQASKLFDQQAQDETDAIQKRGDARQNALDATAEKADKRFDARQEAEQKRFDSENKSLESRFDSRAKSLSDRWDKAMDVFDKTWEARKQKESDYYDNQVKKIQAGIDAEEAAEAIRQKIFDSEKTRIERLSQIANQRIDFNLNLQTGNLDEAAKVFNTMQSQQDQWSLADAGEISQSSSDKRKETLQGQIDKINAEKDARLKVLDEIEAAEKAKLDAKKVRETDALAAEKDREETALKEHQDRQAKALQAERDRYTKSIQASRDAATADTAAQVKAHQAVLDDRKAKLELELMTIKASTPRNKAEYDAQIKAIEAVYQKYGVRLEGYGKAWTGYIASYLTSNISASAASLQSDVNWKQIGATVAAQFTQGAFGMSMAQFGKWVTTGELPPNTVFGKGGALKPEDALAKQRQMERDAFHTGGIIGQKSPGRVGKAGALHSDEVTFTGLRGEAVLNRQATNTLGTDFIHAANNGRIIPGVNGKPTEGVGAGPGMGLVGVMGAGLASVLTAASTAAMTKAAMAKIASTSGGFGPGKPGQYGQISFSAEQLQNAAIISSVGKSMGMTNRDIEIGIMTAITESMLKNLKGGDRDSVGLFQQRPSQGWGSVQQISDPNYASRKFFEALKGVKNHASMDPWMAAQSVQRSAFSSGSNYKQYWDEALAIFTGQSGDTTGSGSILAGPFGPANKTGTAAINWASARIGDEGWLGLCQKFVRMALGAGGGFPSAITAWNGAKYRHGISNPSQVPAGVPVYWGGGQFGHVALSTGNGRLISTDFPKANRIGTGTIAGITSAWHKPLLGWTEDINSKRIYGLPGLKTGGYTLSDGMANLHQGEAVLTAPLTESLKSGIQKIDQGTTNGDVIIDMRGAYIHKDVDVEKAVQKALDKRDNKLGRRRKIGD